MSNITQEPVTSAPTVTDRPIVASLAARRVLAVLRIMFGFYFLWAFVDKLFGLGFATTPERAWINGGSPTTGYLSGVKGPFAGLFHAIAGQAWADWLFMAGLFGIGVALILGIGMRIATVSAVLMLAMMYLTSLPLENNPIIDDHVVDALAITALGLLGAGDVYGLGRTWKALPIVQRNHWLA